MSVDVFRAPFEVKMKRRFEKLDALDQPHVHDHRTSSELSLAHMQTFDLAFPVFQLPKVYSHCIWFVVLVDEFLFQSDILTSMGE